MFGKKLENIQQGEWIWRKHFLNSSDSFMYAHKIFGLDEVAVDASLWISANTVYQLYINDKLIGFGPTYTSKDFSYADMYDVSYYLQPGANSISVIVYYHANPDEFDIKPRGLYCQLEVDGRPHVVTDKSWLTMEGFCYQNNRARCSPESFFNEYLNMRVQPQDWLTENRYNEEKMIDAHWMPPSLTTPTNVYGASLKMAPSSTNSCDENGEFTAASWGQIEQRDAYTHCSFASQFSGGTGVYAAKAYFYYDGARDTVPIYMISDDDYTFFCNHTQVHSTIDDGADITALHQTELPLRPGWNCLQVVQRVRESSMGFAIAFPGYAPNKLPLFSEERQDSPCGWAIVGPLKMPLEDATPSIKYATLENKLFKPSLDNICDAFSWLKCCRLLKSNISSEPEYLDQNEYLTLKLDQLRIGFPILNLQGDDGDIVDITIGNHLDKSGFPVLDETTRCTTTLELRNGLNNYIKFSPCDCTYMTISVRKSRGKVRILNYVFAEIARPQKAETQFTCSDDTLNAIWEVGQEVMRRSVNQSNFLTKCGDDSMYMLDAYGLAVNMISTFGDFHFSESMLRYYAAAQFENGNIPALSSSNQLHTQINHMSFFPMWLAYHYRTSGNEQLVQDLMPTLDMAADFFESLLDDKFGMIVDLDKKFRIYGEINDNVENLSGCSTDVNALYCRFLLSAAEIYRIVNQPEKASKCLNIANSIVRLLHACCWIPSEKVFCDSYIENSEEISCNSFTNMLALFAGVKPPTEYLDYLNYFFVHDPPSSGYPEQTKSRYFNFLFTYTMFALRQTDWTIRYLTDYWGSRIDYEAKAWKESPDTDNLTRMTMSNGNMICPNIFLVREAAGIRSAEPGFSTIYFSPPIHSLKWVNLSMQTISGKLLVKWQIEPDGSLDVTINANFPMKVLPEMSAALMEKTTFRISENIILLDPESNKK